MSIYSFTRISQLPGNYMNTRLQNICQQNGVETVYDVWQHYKGNRRYGSMSGVGKKSQKLIWRIIHKAEEVMDVMPLTTVKQGTNLDPSFTLSGFYSSLDEEGKKMAANVYNRLAMRMRVHARNWLEEACGDLTLEALIETLGEKNNPFVDKKRTNPGSRSEVGEMLYAFKLFMQSDA